MVFNYIFLFAHHEPWHQCNESLSTGVLSSDPQSKDIRSAVV